MKKSFFLIILILTLGREAQSQYTYFNRSYLTETADTGYSAIYVDTVLAGYRTFSPAYANGQLGYALNHFNMLGDIISIDIGVDQILGWGTTGIGDNTVLRIDDDLIVVQTASPTCGGRIPYLFRINDQNEYIWNDLLEEWIECDPWVQMDALALMSSSDSTFSMISRHRPLQDNDLSRFRFTEFTNDGVMISDHLSEAPEWPFYNLGVAGRVEDNFLLGGIGSICESVDVQVVKTDLQGNVLASACFGNLEYARPEPICSGTIASDSNLVIMYSRCENYLWTGEIEAKIHVLKVDKNDLSVIFDVPIDFDVFDNGLISSGSIFSEVAESPFGGFVGVFYYNEPSYMYRQSGILKVSDTGQLEWIKLYDSPDGLDYSALVDISPTPDGGFIATGTSEDELAGIGGKPWLLKIDACGYEEATDCPASIGVGDLDRVSIQIWPNPTYGLLHARLPQAAKEIAILDMSGRTVFQEAIYYPIQDWNFSWLPQGAYLMEVRMENGLVYSSKIIKQ